MKITKLVLLLYIIMLPLLATISSNAFAYTIADAIARAKATNEDLKAKRIRTDIQKLAKQKAFTDFLPKIVAFSQTRHYSRMLPQTNYLREHASASLEIQQEIFNFGGSVAKFHAASDQARAADLSYKNDVNNLTLHVITAYVQVLNDRSMLHLAVQQEKTLRAILGQVETGLKHGISTITDVYRIKSQLSSAIAEREAAVSELQVAEEQYTYIVGEVPPSDITVIRTDNVVLPQDERALVRTVSSRNLNLKLAKLSLSQAKAYKTSTLANLLPRISVGAAVSASPRIRTEASRSYILDNYRGSNTTLELSIVAPIFQQGLEYLAVRESNQQIREWNAIYKDTSEKMTLAAVESWSKYRAQKEKVASCQQAIDSAQVAFDGVREQFQHGTQTITDLLSAQSQLMQTKHDLITSRSYLTILAFQIRALYDTLDSFDYSTVSFPEKKVEKSVKDTTLKYSTHRMLPTKPKSSINPKVVRKRVYLFGE